MELNINTAQHKKTNLICAGEWRKMYVIEVRKIAIRYSVFTDIARSIHRHTHTQSSTQNRENELHVAHTHIHEVSMYRETVQKNGFMIKKKHIFMKYYVYH